MNNKADNKSIILASLVIVLLFVSVVQAFEIANMQESIKQLKENLKDFSVSTANNNNANSLQTLQNNLQNLPTMVGGC